MACLVSTHEGRDEGRKRTTTPDSDRFFIQLAPVVRFAFDGSIRIHLCARLARRRCSARSGVTLRSFSSVSMRSPSPPRKIARSPVRLSQERAGPAPAVFPRPLPPGPSRPGPSRPPPPPPQPPPPPPPPLPSPRIRRLVRLVLKGLTNVPGPMGEQRGTPAHVPIPMCRFGQEAEKRFGRNGPARRAVSRAKRLRRAVSGRDGAGRDGLGETGLGEPAWAKRLGRARLAPARVEQASGRFCEAGRAGGCA